MADFREILGRFGPMPEVAVELEVEHAAVKKWSQRGSIPPRYWPRLINVARRRGIQLTTDELFEALEGRE